VEFLKGEELKQHPEFLSNVDWFVRNRKELVGHACTVKDDGFVMSIVDQHQLGRLVERLYDPNEFLSDYGIRSLSKYHREHPFSFGHSMVRYEPAEEDIKLKGGNSNWRGPIWMPTSYLIVRSLRKFGVAMPELGTAQMAEEIAERLVKIFKRDEHGKRAVFGGVEKFQNDPHWRDYLLFYEHFHGDNGAGIGASHQTGWTSLVANLIDEFRR
jgi:hypothetical protein